MYSELITFLGKIETVNVAGQGRRKKQSKRQVLAKLLNVGTVEFYQAQASGHKPEIKFELADYLDYQNEKEFIFNDIKYEVLRTYRKGRQLEVTGYGGVNNATT